MTRNRINPLASDPKGPGNSLFNFKSFNEIKKDQTKIKIFKNSSFDSSFNSVQSLNTNLSHLLHLDSATQQSSNPSLAPLQGLACAKRGKVAAVAHPKRRASIAGVESYPKFSAILRAIRSFRLNRDEWKLIRYLNQIKKKIRSSPPFKSPTLSALRAEETSVKFVKNKSEGGVSNGVGSTTLLWGLASAKRESNLKSYLYKKFKIKNPRDEEIACTRAGDFNPKGSTATERKNLSKIKKELKKYASLLPPVVRGLDTQGCYNKIFSYNNIISKNILLRNMKFNFLKSTLSTILKKRIRLMSEILEDKPIKHYSLYSYLKFVIFSPPHLKGGRTKLSLNKYKGRKFGSFIKYNKIISYNFISTAPFYQAFSKYPKVVPFEYTEKDSVLSVPRLDSPSGGPALPKRRAGGSTLSCSSSPLERGGWSNLNSYNYKKFNNKKDGVVSARGNIYIKETYKLLFYLFKSMYCLISKPVLNYTNDKVTIQLFYYLNIPKKKIFRLFSISYINSIKKNWLAPPRTLLLAKGWKDGIYPPFALQPKEKGSGAKPPLALVSKGEEGEKEVSSPNQIFTGDWAFLASLLQPKPEGSNIPFQSDLPSFKGQVPSYPPYPNGLKGGVATQGKRLARGGRGNTKIYIRWKLRKAISRLKFKIITRSPSSPLERPPSLAKGGAGKNLLFNLRKFNLTKVYQNKFKLICAILSNKFNKPVELQLIRLHHPYHDSNILVNLLSLNIKNKRKKARVAIQKIYNKKPVKNLNDPNLKKPTLPTAESLARGTGKLIPAFLSGLNIKIAGRLMGEPIIPRITTKIYGKGATAIGKVNYLDVAKITKKNRKGAYTIKITSGQNFF